MVIGFTGSTGYFIQRHIVHSWEFNSNLEVEGEGGPTVLPKKQARRIIIWVAVGLAILVGVLLGGFGAWMIVVKRNRGQERQDRVNIPISSPSNRGML